MLPGQVLSSTNRPAPFAAPRDIAVLCQDRPNCGDPSVHDPLDNYELGGVALNDSSQGMLVKIWRGQLVGDSIVLSADDVAPAAIVTEPGIEEFQFTFDQNMRPAVCYVADGVSKFYWFDALTQSAVTTVYGATYSHLRCAQDDKRFLQGGSSDIILAYVRSENLYFRAQRDRFLVEYLLAEGIEQLVQVGMNTELRFQFRVVPVGAFG